MSAKAGDNARPVGDGAREEELDDQDVQNQNDNMEGEVSYAQDDPRKNTVQKKQHSAKKKLKKGRKRKGSIIISLPDYDTFRNMADTIRDPKERATQLGTPPQGPPRSAPPPEGRVKRLLSILRKGEKRTQYEDQSGQKHWELIIDRVEELKARATESKPSFGAPGQQEVGTGGRTLSPRVALPMPPSNPTAESSGIPVSPTDGRTEAADHPPPPSLSPPGSARSLDQPPQETQGMQNGASQHSDSKGVHSEEEVVLAFAIYDFEAEHQFELTFKEGDVIEVLDRPTGDWWTGRVNGVCGYFPHTFVALYTPPPAPGDSDDEESTEDGSYSDADEPGARKRRPSSPTVSTSIIMLGPPPLPPDEPFDDDPKNSVVSPKLIPNDEAGITIGTAPVTSNRPIVRKQSSSSTPQPSLVPTAPPATAENDRPTMPTPAPSPSPRLAPIPPASMEFSPISSPGESPSSSMPDLPPLIPSSPSTSPLPVTFVPSAASTFLLSRSASPSPTGRAVCSSPPAQFSSSPNTPSQPSSLASSPASTPTSSLGPSPLTSPRVLSATSSPLTPAMKVAAISQSFGGASASPTNASAVSSPPPTGPINLVQERQRMFGASASPAQASLSPSAQPLFTSNLVQERQKMFAGSSSPSSPALKSGGASSSTNPSATFSSPMPSIKQTASIFNSSPAFVKPKTQTFSAVKTVGHAVGNVVSPRHALSSSPTPLSSAFFTPPPSSGSSSPASQSPSAPGSSAPRKFKEGTPIVLSRRKDPASLRSVPTTGPSSQFSQSTTSLPPVSTQPTAHASFSASYPLLPQQQQQRSPQPVTRKLSTESSAEEWNGASPQRPRRNTAEVPPSLVSLFTNNTTATNNPPPTNDTPANAPKVTAATPESPSTNTPTSPQASRAATISGTTTTGTVGRKKSLRVRTPQPLQRINTDDALGPSGAAATGPPATAASPAQSVTTV